MSEQLKVAIQVSIGGATVSASRSFEVTAYDCISVTVPNGSTATELDVQPTSDATRLLVLAVTSDRYSTGLTYKSGSAGAPEITLDFAHILLGDSMKLLGTAAPQKLIFKNQTGQAANVTILVGRQAVVPSDPSSPPSDP